MLMLTAFGVACSDEESSTESTVKSEVADAVEPDPTVSALMEGVVVVKSSVGPTAEG